MDMIRSRAITEHARGKPCTLGIVGICSCNAETTVFAHLNGAGFGKGMGIKAHDIAGFFACHRCHMAYDLNSHDLDAAVLAQMVLRAVVATWLILIEDGVIKVPVDKPKARKVRARKSKDQRAPINSARRDWPSRPIPSRPMRS